MSVSEYSKDIGENSGKISASRRSLPPDRHRTAEEMAPDGGWGWVVFAGTTFSYIFCFGSVTSFGMIFGDFLSETGSAGSALATLTVMAIISFSLSGLFSNELLKRYNIRSIGVLGALIYAVSCTVIAFMPSVSYMAIPQFSQGIGTGIIVCVTSTSMNSYFVKRRAMVFTMSQVIVSSVTIFYPYLAEQLLSTYGFRGCLFVLAGMSFNTVCGMLLVEPVEMHYNKTKLSSRKVSINCDAEMNEKDPVDKARDIDPKINHFVNAANGWKNNRGVRNSIAQPETETPLLNVASTVPDPSPRLVSSLDLETDCHSRTSYGGSKKELFSNRISLVVATSMASMSGVEGLCDLEHHIVELKTKDGVKVNRGIMSILADIFEVSLLRDRIYLNMCFGMTAICTGDAIFQNFTPLILTNDGYTTEEVALVLTIAMTAEMVSRIGLATFVMFFKVKARHIFFGAVCILLLSRIAFLYCHTLWSVIIAIAIINLVRSWCLVIQGLVIAEHVAIEKFTAAFALYVMLIGFLQLIVTPLIGYIKDWTKSYVVMQYILLGVLTLCIVSWAVHIWICDIFPRYKRIRNVEPKSSTN